MKSFTIILPIKGTKNELKYMSKTIPSAIKLNPNEILFGLDCPLNHNLITKINELMSKNNYSKFRVIPIEKDDTWGFHLSNVIWKLYDESKNDIILTSNIDSIFRKEVMLGLDMMGKNNVAKVTFTIKLYINSIGDLVRYAFYRHRVKHTDYVPTGVFWIYRPYIFDMINLSEFKKILNGFDTYLCKTVLSKDNDYKIITRKEVGVTAMTHENTDLDWRQFQSGVWLGANEKNWLETSQNNYDNMCKILSNKSLLLNKLKLFIYEKKLKILHNHPRIYIFAIAFKYNHWKILTGYTWAKKNPTSKAVLAAQKLDKEEYGLYGNHFFKDMKFKDRGTGFD